MATESDVPPSVHAQLARAEWQLAGAGVPDPRDDALTLLSRVLGMSTAALRAGSDRRMRPTEVTTYADWIARRAAGVAIPHITGHLTFMDLELAVDRATPLPPTYAPRLVEIALECVRGSGADDLVAAEMETGCGAVAVALAALEPRFARIYALDSSPEALQMAVANGMRYLLNLVISWLDDNSLDGVREPVDLIIRAACGHADSPAFTDLVDRAPGVLRPGGALICGIDGEAERAADQLSRALPDAHVWTHTEFDGAIVVAQLPRASTSDAAFDSRR